MFSGSTSTSNRVALGPGGTVLLAGSTTTCRAIPPWN